MALAPGSSGAPELKDLRTRLGQNHTQLMAAGSPRQVDTLLQQYGVTAAKICAATHAAGGLSGPWVPGGSVLAAAMSG